MTDPLITAARFLASQLEWLRHAVDDQGQPYAIRAFAEIGQCAGRLRGLVNGPAEQKYLGPCGADLCPSIYEGWRCELTGQHERHTAGDGGHRNGATWSIGQESEPRTCDGDVYGIRGASAGRCRSCGAEVAQDDRHAWLDGEVRAHAFRAAHIAQAYGVNVNTIRSWAARGSLKSYFRTDGGIVAEWVDPAEGEIRERLHYVGDVLDLAAADKARLAGEQAKRARRAAVKAEEASDAA